MRTNAEGNLIKLRKKLLLLFLAQTKRSILGFNRNWTQLEMKKVARFCVCASLLIFSGKVFYSSLFSCFSKFTLCHFLISTSFSFSELEDLVCNKSTRVFCLAFDFFHLLTFLCQYISLFSQTTSKRIGNRFNSHIACFYHHENWDEVWFFAKLVYDRSRDFFPTEIFDRRIFARARTFCQR